MVKQPIDQISVPVLESKSQRESGRFARVGSRELIRRINPVFITFEQFARIASNLRFANFSPLKGDAQRGLGSGALNNSHKSGDSCESPHRFAEIGPSKFFATPCPPKLRTSCPDFHPTSAWQCWQLPSRPRAQ